MKYMSLRTVQQNDYAMGDNQIPLLVKKKKKRRTQKDQLRTFTTLMQKIKLENYQNIHQKQHLKTRHKMLKQKKRRQRKQYSQQNQQSERRQIFKKFQIKCQQVLASTPQNKYFSKSIYSKILSDIDSELNFNLNLKQDQKKSLQCNLIYSLLRLFKWEKITNFLKKKRQKVKMLKISTFQQYILKGGIFQGEQNKQQYKVTKQMLQECIKKLRNREFLYNVLFEKKVYIKLYKTQKNLYLQKMIIFIYKIIQFTNFIQKYLESGTKQNKLQMNQLQQDDVSEVNNYLKQIQIQQEIQQNYQHLKMEREKQQLKKNQDQFSFQLQSQYQQQQIQKQLKINVPQLKDYNKLFSYSDIFDPSRSYDEINDFRQNFKKMIFQQRKKSSQLDTQDQKVQRYKFDLSNDDIFQHAQPIQIQEPIFTQDCLLSTGNQNTQPEVLIPQKNQQIAKIIQVIDLTQLIKSKPKKIRNRKIYSQKVNRYYPIILLHDMAKKFAKK